MSVLNIRFPTEDCLLPLQLRDGNLTSALEPELDRSEYLNGSNNNNRIWELDDLLPMYPDQNIPNIQTYITAKQEFREKGAKVKEEIPEQGKFFSYQELFHRYGMHYDRIFNMQRPGTGKTGAAGGLALKIRRNRKINETFDFIDMYFNKNRSNIKRVIILVNNKLLRNEFRNQLIFKYSLPGEFDIERLATKTATGSKSRAISSMLSDFISIETYRTFSAGISAISDNLKTSREEIIKRYSDTYFIGDEIQNIRIESGEDVISNTKSRVDKRRQAITYENIHYVLHVIERSKVILMSATAAINDAAEVVDIFNLLLPLDNQLPNNREVFKSMTIDDLEPYYRGKISYVRESGTYLIKKQMGEYISGDSPGSKFVYKINNNEYTTSRKIYPLLMIDNSMIEEKIDFLTQGSVYLEQISTSGLRMNLDEIEDEEMINAALVEDEIEDTTDNVLIEGSKNTNFFKQTGKLKQISNGIFPDGSYGSEGFNKYIKFDSNLNDYIATRELSEKINDINYLRLLTCKYAKIIELLQDKTGFPGPWYSYTHLKLGSGAYYLGICLEQHGIEKFRGLNYPLAKDQNFPKKTRYAILTSNITDTEIDNIMRLYNSPENIDGEYIKFLIITPFGREGINLFNSTAFILIDPGWNTSSDFQGETRGMREVSHIDKIRQLRLKYPSMPDIKLDINIYNMCAYVEGANSWELSLYTLSESKNIEIKINERYQKIIAYDKDLHKLRNERPDDVGKEGTDECDYSSCTYPTYDPLPPVNYIDYTTYDILYSEDIILSIISEIKSIFRYTYSINLNSILLELKEYRKKLIIIALERIITNKIPIINRIGNITYLYEDGQTLFVYNEVPLASNIKIKNIYSLNYYNQYLIASDVQNIEDYISDEQNVIQNKAIDIILQSTDTNSTEFITNFENLSLSNKVKLFEDLVSNLQKGQKNTSINQYIFNKYSKSFFTEKEPIRDIAISSQKLSSVGQTKSKNSKKNKQVSPDFSLESISPYKLDIPLTDLSGEEVIIHILYGDLQSKSTISVSPAYNNAEGRIRIFKPSSGIWRDANDYELPIYRSIIINRRKEDIENFKQKGLYGTILGGHFRIINNPEGIEYMDKRKAIKGAKCIDMKRYKQAEIMYTLQISLDMLPPIKVVDLETATNFLMTHYSTEYNNIKLTSDQIMYYYYVLVSRSNRTQLCAVIYKVMDDRNLIYKY